MSKENEMKELETTMEPEVDSEVSMADIDTESKGNSGLIAIVVGGGLALAGLAYAGAKKLKKAKAYKAKKPKTKWKLVRVPVETEEEAIVEDSTDDFEEDEQ